MKKELNESRFGRLVVVVGMVVAFCAACNLGPDPYTPPIDQPDDPNDPPDDSYDGPGIPFNAVKANVMLLVDRSGSMSSGCFGPSLAIVVQPSCTR